MRTGVPILETCKISDQPQLLRAQRKIRPKEEQTYKIGCACGRHPFERSCCRSHRHVLSLTYRTSYVTRTNAVAQRRVNHSYIIRTPFQCDKSEVKKSTLYLRCSAHRLEQISEYVFLKTTSKQTLTKAAYEYNAASLPCTHTASMHYFQSNLATG